MASRRLSPDTALAVRLSAEISRAGHNADHRTVAEDVTAIVELAGDRSDLLAQAIGLHAHPDSLIDRDRKVAAALFALDVPGVDHTRQVRAHREANAQHTSEPFHERWIDLPGLGRVRPGELPGL